MSTIGAKRVFEEQPFSPLDSFQRGVSRKARRLSVGAGRKVEALEQSAHESSKLQALLALFPDMDDKVCYAVLTCCCLRRVSQHCGAYCAFSTWLRSSVD
jgi:hypothetical protein